jgi:hypothetical protein
MAELEIGPLTDRLSDDEIAELTNQIEKLGAPALPRTDDSAVATVEDNFDEEAMSEFFDRLEVYDAAAEIYVPVEFDGSVEVAGMRVASMPVLLDVLEELKEDLDIESEDSGDDDDEEEEDEDEFDEDRRIMEAKLKQVWKIFYSGAQAAMERRMPLHVKS